LLIQINVRNRDPRHSLPREADGFCPSRSSLGLLPKLGGVFTAPPFFSSSRLYRLVSRRKVKRRDETELRAMQAHDHKTPGLLSAALLAVVVALGGLAGAVKIARTAVALGPAVGDIVQFDPKGYLPMDIHTQVAAQRTDASGCVLDLEAIHRSGGSLIVEQRYLGGGNPRYRVHWAGQQSAKDPGDCGQDTDLVLDDTNLDLLAMAAGGWGVGHKHIAPSDLWSGDGNRSTRVQ
jgi:hypothetical protein